MKISVNYLVSTPVVNAANLKHEICKSAIFSGNKHYFCLMLSYFELNKTILRSLTVIIANIRSTGFARCSLGASARDE